MNSQYALALVCLSKDLVDLCGNQYPGQGAVSSKHFKHSRRIDEGLYGSLWGVLPDFSYFFVTGDSVWSVVRVNLVDDYTIIKKDNIIKFKCGIVVKTGTISDCGEFIHSSKEIPKMKANDFGVDVFGIAGVAANMDGEVAVHNGASGVLVNSGHSICSGHSSDAQSVAPRTNAIALRPDSRAATDGEESCAIVSDYNSRARTCGNRSMALALGKNCTGISTGVECVTFVAQPDGIGATGENGTLVMAYHDENGKLRFKVGYVGEEIEANKHYRIENGQFLEIG
jgi:hypothetical protein